MNYLIIRKNIFIILILVCCNKAFSQEYFEGVISYNVDVDLKFEDHEWNEYLSKKWGDTLNVYCHQNGSIKKEYINSKPKGLDFSIYNSLNNISYVKWHGLDTIYYYECSEVATDLESLVESDNKRIMGKDCKSVTLSIIEPINDEKMTTKIYYNEKLKMNPKSYINFKDSFLNKLYGIAKSHPLEIVYGLETCMVTFSVFDIKKNHIDDESFDIPTNFPLKKF